MDHVSLEATVIKVSLVHPDLLVKLLTPPEFARRLPAQWRGRFASKVNFAGEVPAARPDLGECWIWTGWRCDGYGAFKIDRIARRAHRVAYQHTSGPTHDGYDVHHECEVVSCVRPSHLASMRKCDHTRIGNGASAKNAKKTHCPAGHPLVPRGKWRICRPCEKAAEDRYKAAYPDRVRATSKRAGKKYREANRDACLAREARYRDENREAINARRVAERAADPSRLRAAGLRWRRRNLERVRQLDRERKRAAYWAKRQDATS